MRRCYHSAALPTPSLRRHALLQGALIPLLIAFALLFLAEGGCRVAGRLRTGRWPVTRAEAQTRFVEELGKVFQPHPYLVVSGRPGTRFEIPGHSLNINSLGLRGLEVRMPKPSGTYRVVCEGGSTTFDFLASDDASAWPARLDRALRASGGDAVNAGIPGWTSLESLIALEIRDIDLRPDLVILFSGVNDLQPAGHVPFTSDYSLGHGDLLPRIRGAGEVPLPFTSRLLLVERLGDLIHPGRKSAPEGYAPAWEWKGGLRQTDLPHAAVRAFERNLRSTIAVARAHGARTLLVAQAVRFRKGAEERDRAFVESWTPGLTAEGNRRGLERYNAIARALAAEGLADYVDPFESGDFTDADFADAVHFSNSGSERFAAKILVAVGKIRRA